ncbi:MAG: hypothetical protein KA958_12640, partial [Parabacteroides sp.]|nr:hypothetical protein [Parabacteroides sp.]
EAIALTKIIKTINAIHDMPSPAIAKPRGVLKIRRGGEKKKRLSGQQNTHNKLIFIYLQAS